MQNWGYTEDMSDATRIQHKKSMIVVMNKQGMSQVEQTRHEKALDNVDENGKTRKKVEIPAYESNPNKPETHTQLTQESMKLPGMDSTESQEEWEDTIDKERYPASPGFNFITSLMTANLDFPLGAILSPEMKSGRLNDNLTTHALSTIKTQRLAAEREKNDGRTFHSKQQVYSDLKESKRNRGLYDFSLNTNVTDDDVSEVLGRKNLLFADGHHSPTTISEKDIEQFQNLFDKNGKLDIEKFKAKQHKDVLGRPDGNQMVEELTGKEETSGLNAYYKDEYDQAQISQQEGGVMKLNPIRKNNLAGSGELKEFMRDNWHAADGMTWGELEKQPKMDDIEANKKLVATHGHMFDDDENLRAFIIAPSPEEHYQGMAHDLRLRIRDASNKGDEIQTELLQKTLREQMDYAHKSIGYNASPSYSEKQMDEIIQYAQMHNATKLAYPFFKRLIQHGRPDSFKTGTPRENNQTRADASMVYELSEKFMRNRSPEEKRDFLENGKVSCMARDGKTVSSIDVKKLISQDEIDSLVNHKVKRLAFSVGDKPLHNAKEHFLGHESKGERPTGGEVLEGFINGDIGHQDPELERDYKIAQVTLDKVRASCKSKNSNEELIKRLFARYWPHEQTSGEPVSDKQYQKLRHARYAHKGGHHHEGEAIVDGMTMPLMSGGESVSYKEAGHGNRSVSRNLSMKRELSALSAVLQDVKGQTQGSAYAIRGEDQFRLLASSKTMAKLPERLKTIFGALQEETKTNTNRGEVPAEPTELPIGGRHPSVATMPAVATCLASRDKMGTEINPSMTFRHRPLNLLVDEPKHNLFHQPKSQHINCVHPQLLTHCEPGMTNYDDTVSYSNEPQPLVLNTGESLPAGEGLNMDHAASKEAMDAALGNSAQYFQYCSDRVTDDTLIYKDDGRPVPIKSMHRIFDLSDLKHLRGFSGDWVVSHIPEGQPIILQKKGKKAKAYNADMELVELTDDMKQEMAKVNDKDFIVHAVIDEKRLYFIDLLEAADEKTHNMPAKDRVRHLRAHFESSVHIKMPEPYNTKRTDDVGMPHVISLLREESSADILLRDAEGTYMRGEIRHPKWVRMSKEKKIDVIVLDRKGTNYRIGVGPIMHPEHYGARAVEYEEQHYMDVGSAKGPRGFDKGEYVSIFCTGVTSTNDEYPIYTIRSARINRDGHPQAADSVESLYVLEGDFKIPHKTRLKKGCIHIQFPALNDEVIYTVEKYDEGWVLDAKESMWDGNYLYKLAEEMRMYWSPIATVLLKREVDPEHPAGHTKKRKKILPKEEEIIKRGLEMAELMLDRVSKEKITSTGVEGLGIDYASADVESPRGPTSNMNDDTMPDFDPASRDYKEKPAESKKKTTRIRTTEGEEATTDNRGNITITKPRV